MNFILFLLLGLIIVSVKARNLTVDKIDVP